MTAGYDDGFSLPVPRSDDVGSNDADAELPDIWEVGESGRILRAVPHRFIRHGAAFLLVGVLILLGVAAFLRFPDVVRAPFTLLDERAPAPVVARTDGRLILEVEDGERVVEGTVLGAVEGGGDARAIARFAGLVRAVELRDESDITVPGIADASSLGPLQPVYEALAQAVREHAAHRDPDARRTHLAALRTDVESNRELAAKQVAINEILAHDLELATELRDFHAQVTRAGAGTRQQELEGERAVTQAREALAAGEASLEQYRRQMLIASQKLADAEREWDLDAQGRMDAAKRAYAALLAALSEWERDNQLVAPFSGTVVLFDRRTSGPYVPAGDTVLAVAPESGVIEARIELPAATIGRVAEGQTVRLRFDAFPSLRYGHVEGRVESISDAPRGDVYYIRVSLPDGLETRSGHVIPARRGRVGTAEIIRGDRSLLMRMVAGR